MKRFMLAAAALLSLQSFAQISNINNAAIALRNSELEDAKKAVIEAVVHPDTKDDVKAWFYYAAVYDTIYNNPVYAGLVDPDFEEKFFTACKKCIELDAKKRYEYYCKDQAIINAAFRSFNKGITENNKQNYAAANHYYQMVLDVIPYDANGDLKKNNLSEKNIYLYMANASIQGKDKAGAKKYLQKLMDLNYDDHLIYLQMVSLYLEEGDTTSAFKFLDLGRQKYPNEKDLITQELNIYMVQGKQDVLIDKLNAALELAPEDYTLLFVRGTVYDNFAAVANKNYKHDRDTIVHLKKKASVEKVPAKKATYTNAAANYAKSAETNLTKSREYTEKAEQNYLKVIELKEDYIDAMFNLGALNNNKSAEVAERINALSENTPDYNKKVDVLKLKRDSTLNKSLNYFIQALNLAEAKKDNTEELLKAKNAYLKDIYFSIQQVYANLGNEAKTMEFRNKRLILALPGQSTGYVNEMLGQPKSITKGKDKDGNEYNTWNYDNMKVNIANGVVISVDSVK